MAISHSNAAMNYAILPAGKRKENPELAVVCDHLHELYVYEQENFAKHVAQGTERARHVLDELRCFRLEKKKRSVQPSGVMIILTELTAHWSRISKLRIFWITNPHAGLLAGPTTHESTIARCFIMLP